MPAAPPIFAFGFTSLPMLGWLAAAAVPILIHLWSRQKFRETSWAAMEYLLAALKRKTRRLKFEQWLLLAVRTLIVVLVVLAVAEPYWQQTGLVLPSSGRTHRVLVIDGSFSMGYAPEGTSRFEQAKQLARRIVEESRQGDAFTLVLMSSPPRVVVGNPVFEPDDFLGEVDALQLPHTTADLLGTLAKVESVLKAAQTEHSRLTEKEVYFITDLGRTGWLPKAGSETLDALRRQAAALAESARLVVVDLGKETADNVALTAARSRETIITPGQEVELEAVVENFGRGARTRQPVELWVDGRFVDRREPDLAAAGPYDADAPQPVATAVFPYRFPAPGQYVVEFRTVGDSLDVDNHRWMVVPVRQSVRVLCIDGRPSGEPFRGAADFLAFALSPFRDDEEPGRVQAEVATESALLQFDLEPFDCVFLCDVAQFTADEVEVLDSYLNHGGSVVFFLGDQVSAERYHRELGGDRGRPRLLPARLGTIETTPQFGLDPLGYEHPMLEAFRGHPRVGLLSAPVLKYFRLIVPENSPAQVVLRTGNGDPLIVEEPIHRGHVVLVATSLADPSWTPMPVGYGFVPLMQELAAWCAGEKLRQRQVEVGQPFGASVFAPTADVPLSVRGPDGQTHPVRLHGDGDYSTFSYGDTTQSGIYTVRFGAPIDHSQSFAVNVDTAESDLTHLGEEGLRREVWPGVEFVYSTSWQHLDQPPSAAIGPLSRVGSLHVGLLYFALGLLFLETFLAWRFGYHAT
ncbi:MAG TPA: BatA domain-containing protein [Thermoguttaceae bacterium]|nr:BatA domain-containing protein [Thermoguttaceae bacterium]